MRVVTLLPGATEIVAALGGARRARRRLARVRPSRRGCAASPGSPRPRWITSAARARRSTPRCVVCARRPRRDRGGRRRARAAGARPAHHPGSVRGLRRRGRGRPSAGRTSMPCPRPGALADRPHRWPACWEISVPVGRALDLAHGGDALAAGLRAPPGPARQRTGAARPRVLCIEWLEPLYLAGHWVPELVAAAGGRGRRRRPGAHSAGMHVGGGSRRFGPT